MVQTWAPPPPARITVSPTFDESVPADYGSLWNGLDNQFYFPNGFRKGQVFEDNNPPFCFSVANTANKQVQVMLQTVDDGARLCIRDTYAKGANTPLDKCFTDKDVACFGGLTYGNGMQLMVYTDSTGATTSTAFWYRVRVSEATWTLTGADRADSAIQTLEMWCMQQDQQTDLMKFPKDLRSIVPPDVSKVSLQPSGAANIAASIATIAGAIVASLFAAGF